MTLFELQEYCLANAVDAEISGDGLIATVRAKPLYPRDNADWPIVARGYLDEPIDWLLP